MEAIINTWHRLPRDVRVLVLARTVNRLGAFALPFMTLWLTQQLGATIQTAGYAVAAFGLASMASRLVGGWLADHWDRRKTLVVGLLACASSLAAMAAARTVGQAVGAIVLLGLSFEIYESPSQALIADSVEPVERPAAFGLLGAFLSAAAMAAGLLAVVVAPHGLRLLFVADAATCLAAATVVLRFIPATNPPAAEISSSVPRRGPWRNKLLVFLFAVNVVFASCYLQVFVALPLTLRAAGIGPAGLGLLLTVSAVTVILSQPLLRRSTRVLRSPPIAVTSGFALLATGFAGYAVAATLVEFVVATAIAAIGDVLLMGHLIAIVSDIAPSGLRARFLAAYGLSWGVATVVGPPASTWLLAQSGSDALWLAVAGCCAVVGGCQLAVLRRHQFAGDAAGSGG